MRVLKKEIEITIVKFIGELNKVISLKQRVRKQHFIDANHIEIPKKHVFFYNS